jgi:hypothetical protein
VGVKLWNDFCQAQHIDKKNVEPHNHFIEPLQPILSDFTSKYVLQCVGGDAHHHFLSLKEPQLPRLFEPLRIFITSTILF